MCSHLLVDKVLQHVELCILHNEETMLPYLGIKIILQVRNYDSRL